MSHLRIVEPLNATMHPSTAFWMSNVAPPICSCANPRGAETQRIPTRHPEPSPKTGIRPNFS